MKFLFTLQAQVQQFPYIFVENVLNRPLFSEHICIAFWYQTPNCGACSAFSYPLAVETTHYIFMDHL